MSGALEAKIILQKIPVPKQPLHQVTLGGLEGIYHAGREGRKWANSPQHGISFLGSTDILAAVLSTLPLLSKKQIEVTPKFLIREGWTLITRSGTIGRMAYARRDMDGLACSEHVMRVLPDRNSILPGYLYAYLSSKFGVSLIVSSTYGSIIQSIEPHHIANLPVPRLGDANEQTIHDLVQEAADKRTEASQLLNKFQQLICEELKLSPIKGQEKLWTSQSSRSLQYRFDAYYYSEANKSARQAFDGCANHVQLQKDAKVFISGIFKRRYADDPAYGYPYITGANVFTLAPSSDKFLMRSVAEELGLILKKGMIVIHEAGQLSGLIGHSVQVGSYLDGFACTNNMVRVTPHDASEQGYRFAVLSSEYGVRLIQRESAGSSIPHIEVSRVQKLVIPWVEKSVHLQIGQPAEEAQQLRDEACKLE